MNADQAIAIVESRARGRTRYVGQEPFVDEVLVTEIERLRADLLALRAVVAFTLHLLLPSNATCVRRNAGTRGDARHVSQCTDAGATSDVESRTSILLS